MQKLRDLFTRLHRQSIFTRFFIGVALVSTVSVICLAALLFQWFRSNTFEDIKKIKNQELQLLGNTFSRYVTQCEDFTMTLYMNTNLRSVMFSQSREWNSNYSHAVQQVQSILSIHPYVNSIYIINADEIAFRVSNLTEDESSTQMLFDYIQSTAQVSPQVWEMHTIDGRTIRTLTVFFRDGLNNNGRYSGAVALNIDLDKLRDTIFSGQDFSGQGVWVVDSAGNPVISSVSGAFAEKGYAADVLKGGAEGAFQCSENGKEVFVSWAPSSNNFLVVSETEYSNSFESLIAGRNFLLILCTCILLVIIVASLIVSRIVYHPVDHVYQNIRTLFPPSTPEEDRSSEVLFMTKTLKRVSEQMTSLENQRRTDDVVKLLRGTASSLPRDYLVQAGIFTAANAPYLLAVLRIDPYQAISEKLGPEAVSFHITSICALFAESAEKLANVSSFRTEKDTVVLLLSERSGQTPIQQTDMVEKLRVLQETVRVGLDFELTIGVSAVTVGVDSLRETYQNVFELTRKKVFYETGQIFERSLSPGTPDTGSVERELAASLQAIKTGTAEMFLDHLRGLIELCSAMEYKDAIQCLTRLALSIERIPATVTGTSAPRVESPAVYNELYEITDYNSLIAWFTDCAKQVRAVLADVNSRSSYDAVTRAVTMLAEQYADPQLSVNSMAEQLEMSTGYFSRIFNEATGSSFPDYVNNLRLEKAQMLLKNNKAMSIREIARDVGYSSDSYFSSSFKKKYGISPSKFRLNVGDDSDLDR